MLTSIINPSDPYTMESADERVAQAAGLLLGEGRYGLKTEDGTTVLGLYIFGISEEALTEMFGPGGLAAFVKANGQQLASALESVTIGDFADRERLAGLLKFVPEEKRLAARAEWHAKRRSSLNDIGARAAAIAEDLREMSATAGVENT